MQVPITSNQGVPGTESFCRPSKEDKQSILTKLRSNFESNSYEELRDEVKHDLQKLATPRNDFRREVVNRFCHTKLPDSIQEAIVLLAVKKFALTDANAITFEQARSVINDLLIKVEDGKLQYDVTDGHEDSYKQQMIGAIKPTFGFLKSTSFLDKGKERVQQLIKEYKIITCIPTEKKSTVQDLPIQLRSIAIDGKQTACKDIPPVDQNLTVGTITNVRIGDINGNPIFMLHQLIQTGVLNVKNKESYDLLIARLDQHIYPDVDPSSDYADVNNHFHYNYDIAFPSLLVAALEHNNKSTASVLFYGDMLNDKVGNDFYVLDVLTFLKDQGVKQTTLASNHDMEAVRAYFKSKSESITQSSMGETSSSSSDDERLLTIVEDVYCEETPESPSLIVDAFPSYTSSVKTLQENRGLQERYEKGMQNYLQHLQVYQFSEQTRLISGHAPPSEYSVNAIAKQAGLSDPEEYDLGEKVSLINRWFKEEVLQDSLHFNKYYPESERFLRGGLSLINYTEFPLYTATSGTGCTCAKCAVETRLIIADKRGIWGDPAGINEAIKNLNYEYPDKPGSDRKYIEYQLPKGADKSEHGHIAPPHGTDTTSLDSHFGIGVDQSEVQGGHKVGIEMTTC